MNQNFKKNPNLKQETLRILAEGQTVSNDTWKTGLNNNDLIIGPSGAGKTRGYVLPNIMQCNESIIVADSKHTLMDKTQKLLQENGYHIININISDLSDASCDGYNPLDYIHYDEKKGLYSEQDIMTVSACLVPCEDLREPFWEHAARMFLDCLIAYVLECLPEQEHHLGSVETLFLEMGNKYFHHLFRELGELNPQSFAYRRYKLAMTLATADKTFSSVMGILAEKLSTLLSEDVKALFQKTRKIHFQDLGRRKTAVFIGVSDTDRSCDRLVTLFFTQALHELCLSADTDYPSHRLPIPVRLILDDFAANGSIPDLDKIISVIRSREISVSIILQSLSQLEALYGPARSKTILNNCDTCLYLGGQDVDTARYVSMKADKSVHCILNMPPDNAWLFQRGHMPKSVRKYLPENHALYGRLKNTEYTGMKYTDTEYTSFRQPASSL